MRAVGREVEVHGRYPGREVPTGSIGRQVRHPVRRGPARGMESFTIPERRRGHRQRKTKARAGPSPHVASSRAHSEERALPRQVKSQQFNINLL